MMPKKKKASQQKVEKPAQGGDAPRRERAETESSFGSDELFDDDGLQATPQFQGAATPNPEHRRPTISMMGHKMAKTFGFSKGSSTFSGARGRGSNSGSEQIPSLSSSPVMASPRSPTSSDELWTDLSVTTSPLTGPLPSPVS